MLFFMEIKALGRAYGITKKRSFLVMRIVSIPKVWGYDLHKA